VLWRSNLCATSFQKKINKQITKQESLTCCLLKLLCSASNAAGAPCTALLLTAGAIALVLHEEPQFAVKTDASWCTPVKLQNKTGAYYCTAGLSKGGEMLLIVMHMYLCMHIALVSQHAWCHYHAVPANCKHPEPTCCFYICAFAFSCHKVTPSFLTGSTLPQHLE